MVPLQVPEPNSTLVKLHDYCKQHCTFSDYISFTVGRGPSHSGIPEHVFNLNSVFWWPGRIILSYGLPGNGAMALKVSLVQKS